MLFNFWFVFLFVNDFGSVMFFVVPVRLNNTTSVTDQFVTRLTVEGNIGQWAVRFEIIMLAALPGLVCHDLTTFLRDLFKGADFMSLGAL